MAGKIFIESKRVGIEPFQHLYLVFRDSNGTERVIRGGPTPLKGRPPTDALTNYFGNILIEAGVLIENSEDVRYDKKKKIFITPEQRYQKAIDLSGRNAQHVWDIMMQHARNIGNAGINYNALINSQNSNSTVVSTLAAVGIDFTNNVPVGKKEEDFPGYKNFLDFSTTLEGTDADDIIQGGKGDDIFIASQGNDFIVGGYQYPLSLAQAEDGKDSLSYEDYSDNLLVDLRSAGLGSSDKTFYISKINSRTVDAVTSIEKLKLSQAADEVILSPQGIKGIELNIDANTRKPGSTNQGADKDTLDLEAFTAGIMLSGSTLYNSNNDVVLNPNLKLGNFEIFKYGPGNDIHSVSNSLTDFHSIDLGGGNDTFLKGVQGSIVNTGSGNDKVIVGNNIQFNDLDNKDRIAVFLPDSRDGKYLTGGTKSAALDSPWVIDDNHVSYAPNKDNQLVIKNTLGHLTFISGSKNGPDESAPTGNISLGEITIDSYRIYDESIPSDWFETTIATAKFMYKARNGVEYNPATYDPLVLDLDGDGIELSPLVSDSLQFDLDGDGFAEGTGWVRRDDALLVHDKNGNGTIDDIAELFGMGATSGFVELQALNDDGDEWFTDADSSYRDVQIWQDLNQNGLSEANELTGLSDAGISQISLSGDTPAPDANDQAVGNVIAATGSFVRNGVTGTVGDVRFAIDNYNTRYLGDTTISTAAAALPEVKGYGVLPNLRVAMTQDTTLRDAVEAVLPTLNSLDIDTLRDRALPVFSAWGEANTDITGQGFGGKRPNVPVFVTFNDDGEKSAWDFALQNSDGSWRLHSGSPIKDEDGDPIENPTYADVLAVPLVEGGQWDVLTGDEISFLERYFGQPMPLTGDANESSDYWTVNTFIDTLHERLDLLALRLAVQGPLSSFFVGIDYDVVKDKFVPTSSRQLTPTFEAILSGAPQGAAQTEAYLTGWQDVIRLFIGNYDRETAAKNTYSFITANLVTAYENIGIDLELKAAAEAIGIPEDIVIESSAATVDGTTEEDIFYINSSKQSDIQTFLGGKGSDAYVFGRDFGSIVVDDYEEPLSGSPDMLRFSQLNADDVTFTRNGVDLTITVDANGDSVLVKGQFADNTSRYADNTGVAEISFADGTYYDIVDIARQTPKPALTNDEIIGTASINFYDGGSGFDAYTDVDQGDVYIFGEGYSHDIINEFTNNVELNSVDYVQFKDGIKDTDLRFEKELGSNNLHVYVNDSADILSIMDQYQFDTTVLFGDLAYHQVEIFDFEESGYLYADEILRIALRELKSDADSFVDGTEE